MFCLNHRRLWKVELPLDSASRWDIDSQAQKSSLDPKEILAISFELHWQSSETTKTNDKKQ